MSILSRFFPFKFEFFRSQSSIPDSKLETFPPLVEELSSPGSRRYRWKPTSEEELAHFEKQMLGPVDLNYRQELIPIEGNHLINTLIIGTGPPVILLHGFGGGIGIWNSNLKELSKSNTVYCIDLPGFGRSSRIPFHGKTPEEAETYFLEAIDKWIEKMKFNDKVKLLGHSFGGYLAACYALKFPEKVKQLILADPWGISEKPQNFDQRLPFKYRALLYVSSFFNPLAIVRGVGPMGPSLITKFRNDLESKFAHVFSDQPFLVSSYVYHLNAQNPTGETAFHYLTVPIGWAKKPLVTRLGDLHPSIFVNFIYGQHTWMDKGVGKSLSKNQLSSRSNFHIIDGAGHHVYIDNFPHFNSLVGALLQEGRTLE